MYYYITRGREGWVENTEREGEGPFCRKKGEEERSGLREGRRKKRKRREHHYITQHNKEQEAAAGGNSLRHPIKERKKGRRWLSLLFSSSKHMSSAGEAKVTEKGEQIFGGKVEFKGEEASVLFDSRGSSSLLSHTRKRDMGN